MNSVGCAGIIRSMVPIPTEYQDLCLFFALIYIGHGYSRGGMWFKNVIFETSDEE